MSAFPRPGEPHPGHRSGTRVWLLRHAEVREDWQGVAYGDLDVPLSPAGEAVTRERGRAYGALRPAAVVASPLARARALGEAVAGSAGVSLEVEDGLRELHRGAWQGEPREALERDRAEEVTAYYADPWSFDGHGGETDAEILARAWPVLEDRLRRVPGRTVVLATHYNVARVVLAHALGVPPARSFGLRLDPGAGAMLVDATVGWVLAHLGVADPARATPEGVGHLDGMGIPGGGAR